MKRRKKRKLKKSFKMFVFLFLSGVFLISAGISFQIFARQEKKKEEKIYDVALKEEEVQEASLVMVGDALIHSAVYQDARQADGSYDFKPMIARIKPIDRKSVV